MRSYRGEGHITENEMRDTGIAKILKTLVWISGCILVLSCSAPKHSPVFNLIDSLSYVAPKEALRLLDSVKIASSTHPLSKSDEMYYHLLCIKSSDNAYIEHQSDSIVQVLIGYYEHTGQVDFLRQTYYYAGRIYVDLNDSQRALECFQKAAELIPANLEPKVKGSIYFQMARLFLNQALYSNAIEMYRITLDNDRKRNDCANAVHTLRDMGYTYGKMGMEDSCLSYYAKALDLAKQVGNEALTGSVYGQMTSYYIEKKDFEKAKETLFHAFGAGSDINRSPNYTMALKIYMNTKQYDSAFIFAERLLTVGTLQARQTANRCLTELYLKANRYDESLECLNRYYRLTDSVKKVTATEALCRMNALYNYNKREKENLKLKADNARFVSVFSLVSAVCIILVFVLVLQIRRNRKRRKIQMERLLKLRKELFEKSEEFVQKNSIKITELENKLNEVSSENQLLIDELEKQRQNLVMANEMATVIIRRQNTVRARIAASSIYSVIHEYIRKGKVLSEIQWNALDEMLNQEIENFKSKIYGFHHISVHEYRLCLLIALDITPKEMGSLMGCSSSAISKARTRMQEKFFGDKGNAKDFDAFIKSL